MRLLLFFLAVACVSGHGIDAHNGEEEPVTVKDERKVHFKLESPVVPVGAELKFNFTLRNLSTVHEHDWIGVFRWKDLPIRKVAESLKDASSSKRDYGKEALMKFATRGDKQGTHKMVAPKEEGNWVFRYISGETGEIHAESAPLMTINCATAKPDAYSAIKHVVLIVQENHSFDAYFSFYCKADPGSKPKCTDGPNCCEHGPWFDPGTNVWSLWLNDLANGISDRNHFAPCETAEINGGKMDKFVYGSGVSGCSSWNNFAYASGSDVGYYHTLASQSALNDRYFQPLVGATASNNIFFARAEFGFWDNDCFPIDAVGSACNGGPQCPELESKPTIGDMLKTCGIPWSSYAEGYQVMRDTAIAQGTCPPAPSDCLVGLVGYNKYPCSFDPSDIPFQYFTTTKDNPDYMKDLSIFFQDINNGTLPAFSYVKPIGYKTEHPGGGTTLSAGQKAVKEIVDAVVNSAYFNNTLIIFTYDEGGGFFDHVAPPPTNTDDNKPYGTRVPFMTLGYFTKQNYISHTYTEHSSVVKFLEWNFFGQDGQLNTRDKLVSHFSDMLDQNKTGPLPAVVPYYIEPENSCSLAAVSPLVVLLVLLVSLVLR